MNYLVWLATLALVMGLVGLIAFLWSMRAGQLEDLDGAAERILPTGAADRPLPGLHFRSSGAAVAKADSDNFENGSERKVA